MYLHYRLLSIEKKYRTLLTDQKGSGKDCENCRKQKDVATDTPLSEIIMRNEKQNALQTPVPKIGPSIGNPLEQQLEPLTSTSHHLVVGNEESHYSVARHSKKVPSKWYYIGDM